MVGRYHFTDVVGNMRASFNVVMSEYITAAGGTQNKLGSDVVLLFIAVRRRSFLVSGASGFFLACVSLLSDSLSYLSLSLSLFHFTTQTRLWLPSCAPSALE